MLCDKQMDINRICRICIKADKQTFDIFSYYCSKTKTKVFEMLSYCTKLKPQLNDGYPRLICKDCIRQLKKSYTFNILCEKSEHKLRSYINNVKIEVDVDVKTEKEPKKEKVNLEISKTKNNFVQDDLNLTVNGDKCKEEIKYEFLDDLIGTEDNDWDAEDDNIILRDIKQQIDAEIPVFETPEVKEEKPKKTRGRKKKVLSLDKIPDLPESKLPHQCDICGKILSTRSNLKAHKICHTDLRPYKCVDCNATFRGHSALYQHRRTHTGETPYHCEYCPKQFKRRTGLLNHLRMHTGEKTFSCTICSKKFVQSGQLSIHMKRHKGDKPYLCQDCGKGFPLVSDLKVHQRIHNGEKPYSCHLCTKTFSTSGNLSIHIRIHNKEIRYHCKECNRGFVTCSAFKVHVKRHKGQRDYLCECGKTFYTSSALKQHKVVHTGEKKYQCKICARRFTQTSHLSRHYKRDHMKAPVKQVVAPSTGKPMEELEPDKYKLMMIHQLFDSARNEQAQNMNESVKREGTR